MLVSKDSMDPKRSAVFRVVQDIPEAGYVRGNFVVLTLTDGPGERRIGPEVLEIIRWLGQRWLEEVPVHRTETPESW